MIKSVSLENWKSHKKSFFEFGKGANILIGAIGSGKTSVMDGICFALFGTYPALNAKRISLEETIMSKPNAMDYAKVKLEFYFNEKNYAVERIIYRKGANEAKLYLEERLIAGPKPTDVTNKVQEILQVDFHLFSRAIYAEQNQIDFFLRLSPRQRKEKFDELLDLNRYEKARANAVSVQNIFKKSLIEKGKWLKEQEQRIDLKELKALKEKQSLKEKEFRSLEEEKKKKSASLQSLQENLKELEEKEKAFKELNQSLISAQARAKENLDKAREIELRSGITLTEIKKEEVEEKNEFYLKELSAWREQKDKLKDLKHEVELAKERLDLDLSQQEKLEKEVVFRSATELDLALEQKEKQVQGKEKEIAAFKKEIDSVQERLNGLIQNIKLNEAKQAEIMNVLTQLEKAGANCPVCKRSLEEHSREELREENQAALKELSSQIKDFSKGRKEVEESLSGKKEKLASLEEELLSLKDSQRKLLELKEKMADLKKLRQEIKTKKEGLNKVEGDYKQAFQKFPPKKEAELQEKIEALKQVLEGLVLQEKAGQLEKEVKEKEKQLKELGFKEEALKEKRSALIELKAGLDSLKKQAIQLQELMRQIKANIEAMEKSLAQVKELKEQTESLDVLIQKMTLFINALKATQSHLREALIDNINLAMDDIWVRLYPYGDYSSVKIEIVDGDYEVLVRERGGKWIRVEGILSGGERSAVALTLRIALSLVLTRNLSWLILDEPTHNLDTLTVRELSSMMREHLPELVEQIFVITHDKEMEKAASAALYLLERDKSLDGITKPVLQQTE